ncbi:CLUMA_CG015887, isoform A [Clunio marinus]|uniref:Transmembrane protein 186 n=1 Tax=Clunio marinus TaxID=568069 RepID=A0A1J1IVJ4_9DIPT|nr:CLUMA_CG015887, isoform A [Clunio marinus]
MLLLKFILNSKSRSYAKLVTSIRYERGYCSSEKLKPAQKPGNLKPQEEWKPVYKCSLIQQISVINRLKFYHLGGAFFLIPFALSIPEIFHPQVVAYIGFTGSLILFAVSYIFQNMIGFVYINKVNPNLVKFSYINFYGRRVEYESNIDDIVPIDEHPSHIFNKYTKSVQFHNTKLKLKIFHTFGLISNYDLAKRILGMQFD